MKDEIKKHIPDSKEVSQEPAEPISFLNPLNPGVSYDDFLMSIPEGITLEEYCGQELTADQIEWLKLELKHFNNNKNHK